jgi:hypothetical protein
MRAGKGGYAEIMKEPQRGGTIKKTSAFNMFPKSRSHPLRSAIPNSEGRALGETAAGAPTTRRCCAFWGGGVRDRLRCCVA